MTDREAALREAFARYEAMATCWASVDELVAAVSAFCAVPASEVGENDAASGQRGPQGMASRPGSTPGATQAATPTSPAAPPERESADPSKLADRLEQVAIWHPVAYEDDDQGPFLNRADAFRLAVSAVAFFASAPPEAAAETPCGCERCREYRKSQEWLANAAPTQAASPPPTEGSAGTVAGESRSTEPGRGSLHQPMPEPWRVTDQLLDAWLADAEVAPVAVAEMLKPLTINLVRNVVDARAQLAEAREELALYRSGEIVSKIAGDRIMSANKESHEGIREGIAKLGDSAKEALGKALGAISAATERAEAAERELAAVTADLEMQMENCQYCYAERQIRERAEAELATLRAQVETAQRLAMLVMGEAYDVEMGDADGHVGPSDEAVKLAMKFAAEMRAASTSTPEPPKETTTP